MSDPSLPLRPVHSTVPTSSTDPSSVPSASSTAAKGTEGGDDSSKYFFPSNGARYTQDTVLLGDVLNFWRELICHTQHLPLPYSYFFHSYQATVLQARAFVSIECLEQISSGLFSCISCISLNIYQLKQAQGAPISEVAATERKADEIGELDSTVPNWRAMQLRRRQKDEQRWAGQIANEQVEDAKRIARREMEDAQRERISRGGSRTDSGILRKTTYGQKSRGRTVKTSSRDLTLEEKVETNIPDSRQSAGGCNRGCGPGDWS